MEERLSKFLRMLPVSTADLFVLDPKQCFSYVCISIILAFFLNLEGGTYLTPDTIFFYLICATATPSSFISKDCSVKILMSDE